MAYISSSVPDDESNAGSSIDTKFLLCKGVKPETIREILHETGYQADIEEVEDGHKIYSGSNGNNFCIRLHHFNKKMDGYEIISISTYYSSNLSPKTSVPLMNQLNSQYGFIRGYVDDDGDLAMQMDCLVGKGVSMAQLTQWLDLWKMGMCLFEDYWAEFEDDRKKG